MSATPVPIARTVPISTRAAGVAYLTASVGFLLVFSWLAAHFGYPDVLDHSAADVLPELLALGSEGRSIWALYAVLPLLLIPGAAGAAGTLRHTDGRHDVAVRLGVMLQVVAALCMTLGLARWSTAQWVLAEAWHVADDAQRVGLSTMFDAFNSLLGNGIGEFVGELALYGSFAAFALALRGNGVRWLAGLGALTAISGWIGMFRNVTSVVQPAADITNFLLPLFLIAFGVALVRGRVTPRES